MTKKYNPQPNIFQIGYEKRKNGGKVYFILPHYIPVSMIYSANHQYCSRLGVVKIKPYVPYTTHTQQTHGCQQSICSLFIYIPILIKICYFLHILRRLSH